MVYTVCLSFATVKIEPDTPKMMNRSIQFIRIEKASKIIWANLVHVHVAHDAIHMRNHITLLAAIIYHIIIQYMYDFSIINGIKRNFSVSTHNI